MRADANLGDSIAHRKEVFKRISKQPRFFFSVVILRKCWIEKIASQRKPLFYGLMCVAHTHNSYTHNLSVSEWVKWIRMQKTNTEREKILFNDSAFNGRGVENEKLLLICAEEGGNDVWNGEMCAIGTWKRSFVSNHYKMQTNCTAL